MWKLNHKKGFTLIEVLCSITVFSILFMAALSIEINSLKIKKLNSELYSYSLFMEEIKNIMIYNCSYNKLQKLSLENKYYISKENMQIGKIKEKGIEGLFQQVLPSEKPYLVMIVEGDKVLKAKLKLYIKYLNSEKIMECEFYKGKYKR